MLALRRYRSLAGCRVPNHSFPRSNLASVALILFLVRRGGGESGGRLCGREHDKDYADDHEGDRTPQKSDALVRKLEAHRAHDEGVREARPSGEGDEASVRGRVTCGD